MKSSWAFYANKLLFKVRQDRLISKYPKGYKLRKSIPPTSFKDEFDLEYVYKI